MANTQRSSSGSRTLIILLTLLLGLLVIENILTRRATFLGFLNYQIERRSNADSNTTRKQCLTTHFEQYGSKLEEVTLSAGLTRPRTPYPAVVMIAASNKGYKYAGAWRQHRMAENVSFVLFETRGALRNGELTAHYARVPALLAVIACLPRARLLAYSDMDTLLDVAGVPELAARSSRPVTISWKPEGARRTLRTNWFVVKSTHADATHFLLTWFYNGRRAQYQDQTVLNDLVKRKKWFRDAIQAVPVVSAKHIELRHCYSALKNRKECMESLQLPSRARESGGKAEEKAVS